MNKTKKLLSILLALMMMLSVVPFYASAEAVALTEANVLEWPTVEYKNADGKYYYEQPIEEGLALTGGVVTTDGTANGTVIEGKFEFNYEGRSLPTYSTASRAYIKFVPNDTDKYVGFSVDRSTIVKFAVTRTTPVFADETNDPLVATEVEPGATLSTSTISGGKLVNPYNPNAEKLAAKTWKWTLGTAIVEKSGYYEARFVCPSYVTVTAQVFVRVKGDTSVVADIEELPTVEAITYREGLTAGDLVITGGKASVAGTFKVKDATQTLKAGTNNITLVFVPDDTSVSEVDISIKVTVDKIPVYFIDDEGNKIVPEIVVPFGTTTISASLIEAQIAGLKTNYTEFTVSGLSTVVNTKAPGEYDSKISIKPGNNNYSNGIDIKLIVEPIKVAKVTYYGNAKSMHINFDYKNIPGTFDIYVDGALVGSALKLDVNGILKCPYDVTASGTHKLSLVYNKADSTDTCVVDSSEYDFTANAKRNITTEGLANNLKVNGKGVTTSTHIYCADEISIECAITDTFAGWEITDTDGNAVDVGEIKTQVMNTTEAGVTFEKVAGDLSCVNIIFTMPDKDIIIKAKSTLDEEKPSEGDDDNTDNDNDGTTGGIEDIFGNLGDLTEGDSDNPFENIISNLIEFFKNIINTIKNFFRGIGDMT